MVAPGRISQLYHTPAFLSRKIGRKTVQKFSHNLVQHSLLIFWKIFVIIYLQGKERHQVYKIKKNKKKDLTNCFTCVIMIIQGKERNKELKKENKKIKKALTNFQTYDIINTTKQIKHFNQRKELIL